MLFENMPKMLRILKPFNLTNKKSLLVKIFINKLHFYERGLSFFSLYNANRDTLATFTTLNRTPKKNKNLPIRTGGLPKKKKRQWKFCHNS